jgi:Transposase DDE domain group 1
MRSAFDLDPTDDPTHGSQQMTFFNAHYDTWCYLPVAGFLTFNHEPEQYLFAYVLRPGNAPASCGAIGILSRVLERLRAAFPRARVLVRLDGGFATPQIFEFLEAEGCDYVVAIAKNVRLSRRATRLMARARRQSKRTGRTAHVYGETQYAARRWKKKKRRVIVKAEVVRHEGRAPKDNPRFVVTTSRAGLESCMKECIAAEQQWRIGSRSCTTDWRSTARAVRPSWPTNCAYC